MTFPFRISFIRSLEIQQGDNDWQEYATIVDSLAYTIKDLQPGNAYRFRVRAENIHGRSEPSLCSDFVTINANCEQGIMISDQSATVHVVPDENMDTPDHSNDDNQIVVRQGGDFKARFVVEEELGKGRFGIVHRVVERETGQVLAAKIVKCIKAKDKLKVSDYEMSHVISPSQQSTDIFFYSKRVYDLQ